MEFKSVNKILQDSLVKNWDRPAVTNYQGMTLAYREVALRIAKLHIAFEMCGLKKGDKVITDNVSRLREGLEVTDLGKKDEEK